MPSFQQLLGPCSGHVAYMIRPASGLDHSLSTIGLQTMQAFIWQEELIGVAKFINACLKKVNPPLSLGSASDQPGVAGRDVNMI